MPEPEAANSKQRIRVFLLDDQDFYVIMLRAYLSLEPDMEVVGSDFSTEAGLAKLIDARPDVAIVSPEMAELPFTNTLQRIRAALPGTGILALTFNDTPFFRELAEKAGADAYVTKYSAPAELLPDIRRLGRR
jgi:two-component system, NarL family, invasion response regulator UvrY